MEERVRMNLDAVDVEDGMSCGSWAERRGGGRLRRQSISDPSLMDTAERRTQKTYRYGIGLVCIGATLNWLGFAQGHGYVDPLRYLGVACVISGSFCVCMAMCRWLGRPIAVSSSALHPFRDEGRGSGQNGDVHVINVSVPSYNLQGGDYTPSKPPDYDTLIGGEPPPYDEAIKLPSSGEKKGFSSSFPGQVPSSNHNHPSPTSTSAACSEKQQQVATPPPPYRSNGQLTLTPTPTPPKHHGHRRMDSLGNWDTTALVLEENGAGAVWSTGGINRTNSQ